MNDEVVEIVYSVKEDLAGKYLEHFMKIGLVKSDIQKLYYNAITKAYMQTMPVDDLLGFSALIDKEINSRFGTREFEYIKDSQC